MWQNSPNLSSSSQINHSLFLTLTPWLIYDQLISVEQHWQLSLWGSLEQSHIYYLSNFESEKQRVQYFFDSLFSSASLSLSRFFFLSASPLSHQFNSGVLSKAFPQVVSSGQNPTPLSPVQLQQEGEDIFIGLWGDISMAAIISRSRVV